MTDRAELERRLMQADKLSSIGLLAAGVAHEVNTPLAVISTYAQMLAKQISGDEQKRRHCLKKSRKQTFRASEIVNSLLNFSRTSPTEFVSVDLNKVISETVTLMEHQLGKARIEVKLALDEKLPRIRGNPGKLQQVFLNLFLNARDAMEHGGVVGCQDRSLAGRASAGDGGRFRRGHRARKSARAYSIRSSPPRPPKKAPAWGSRSATESCGNMAAKSKLRASWALERASSYRSRSRWKLARAASAASPA